VLRASSSAPSVLLSVPSAILTVNSSADTNARDNVLTLREAILLANGDPVLPLASLTAAEQGQIQGVPAPGLDEIRFNIPSGSLSSENDTVSKARARLSEAAQAEGPASQSVDSRVSFLPTFADKVSGAFNLSPAVFPCDTRPFPEVLTPVGNVPFSSVIADFNEDGLPDLAVANAASNSVSVLLGAGAGNFSPATNYAVGPVPRAITAADFNNDGNLDLAVVNGNSDFVPGSISILLGTGAGGFGPHTQFPGRIAPAALVVGFFNEDGLLDIAVANNRSNSVSIYIGKVTGGFADAVDFPISGAPNSIAVADFNGDSELDLAVSNPDNVAVLIGTGTGSFGVATNFAVGTRPVSVAVADFNGDNKLDIVTANQTNVTVLRGTGTGNFNIRLDFPLGASIGSNASSTSLAVGEFTGDNNLDVVVITGSHTSFILMTGSSNGILTASTINLTFGSNPNSVTAGDLNGDGELDLVVTNSGATSISILFGSGAGSFSTVTANFTAGGVAESVATGDFNGDGKPDLAVAASDNNGFDPDLVSILLGTGTGSFGPPSTFTVGFAPKSIGVGFFNADTNLDLAVVNNQTNDVSILLGNGMGGFGPATNFAVGSRPLSVAVADFNGDTEKDLAVANTLSNTVSILLGTGTGSFGAATPFATGIQPTSVAVGHFNADGNLDLAVANHGQASQSCSAQERGALGPQPISRSAGYRGRWRLVTLTMMPYWTLLL
jgi:hypothetical protein